VWVLATSRLWEQPLPALLAALSKLCICKCRLLALSDHFGMTAYTNPQID
jgi:hypothetical protein